jgi:hypothetical protein
MERDKARVAQAYNKKVKSKSFQVRDSVWKTVLPLGRRAISLTVLPLGRRAISLTSSLQIRKVHIK